MFPGILSKFLQNAGIASFLKNTGTKTILECCYDKVWGNGIPLSNSDSINLKKYKSQGILRSMLEQVRDILLGTNPNKENMTPGSIPLIPSQMTDAPILSCSTTSALPMETTAMPV